MTENLVIDTPDGIEAYRILATYHGLKLEIRAVACGWPATSCPTRGLALRTARSLVAAYALPGPTRTRKQALAALQPLYEHIVPKQPTPKEAA